MKFYLKELEDLLNEQSANFGTHTKWRINVIPWENFGVTGVGDSRSASFEYNGDWLKHPQGFAIDPALPLGEGVFHTPVDQVLFGVIGDTTPDRWGCMLMRQRENLAAKEQGKTPRTLLEKDYLLGVSDEARKGALRFSLEDNGPYLASKGPSVIPPFIELPKLLSATERYLSGKQIEKDLKMLLVPGSSLGGARPKASVWDQDGHLSIAKFPHKDDQLNTVRWEAVALTLAEMAGVQTSKWRLENIAQRPVLIVRRFDREGANRVPFLSAMSILEARDNQPGSYMEMADALKQYGGRPKRDMEELWRRIVFTVLISNTDDHLRNHGFLYQKGEGWCLSPAYDINPTPVQIKERVLSTSIDHQNLAADIDTALSVSEYFQVQKERAKQIVLEVATAVSKWRDTAKRLGLGKKEINEMASAFEHGDLEKALSY